MTKNQIYSSILIIFLMASLFYGYAKYNDFFPSTDDAYLQANIVNIAAQVTGPVKDIFVEDHQFVKAGQLLFTIDPKPFEIALEQSKANLAETQALLDTQSKDTSRILELVTKGQMTKMEGDDAEGKLTQLTASLKVAQSELNTAELNLQYTNILAPSNGYITNFTLRKGEMVQATSPLFALVENDHWWVNANFKETDLERIKIGQSAKIIFDMYPSITFKGKVQGISAGSGATFAVLPPENATGNWVKVTQRFPVRIDIINPDSKYPLRMGASCEATVNTR
jgi:membrane fusion protein (multidrug efflux system)